MSGPRADRDVADSEYEALLSFMYLSPVGLIRSDLAGAVDLLNPLAAQLLMPLPGAGALTNLFDSLAGVAPELRALVHAFAAPRGRICDQHRIHVSSSRERPVVLACTIIRISDASLMTVLTDISRQVAAERRARETESWLAGLYTSVKDFAYFTLDGAGRVESWNASVGRLTGFVEADVLGHPMTRFHAKDDASSPQRAPEHVALTRDEGWHVEECWCETKQGVRYWGQVMISVLREEEGRFSGYVVVLRDVTERKMTTDNLARLISTDHLTGAANRAHFFESVGVAVTRAQRNRRTLSLVMLDADHFKRINDTAGHPAGDAVLQHIVAQARALLRPADMIARLGGEEFAIVLEATALPDALAVAERLRIAVQDARIETPAGIVRVTLSLGVATLAHDDMTLDALLAAADAALYDAKRTGRNRVCVHTAPVVPHDR